MNDINKNNDPLKKLIDDYFPSEQGQKTSDKEMIDKILIQSKKYKKSSNFSHFLRLIRDFWYYLSAIFHIFSSKHLKPVLALIFLAVISFFFITNLTVDDESSVIQTKKIIISQDDDTTNKTEYVRDSSGTFIAENKKKRLVKTIKKDRELKVFDGKKGSIDLAYMDRSSSSDSIDCKKRFAFAKDIIIGALAEKSIYIGKEYSDSSFRTEWYSDGKNIKVRQVYYLNDCKIEYLVKYQSVDEVEDFTKYKLDITDSIINIVKIELYKRMKFFY